MKIRTRTLINNLIVGLIPLLIVTVILTVLNNSQTKSHIQEHMSSRTRAFKSSLDDILQKFRDYSYFIANQNLIINENSKSRKIIMPENSILANRFNLRMFEIFLQDSSEYKDLYSWKDNIYSMNPRLSGTIWNILQKPLYTRRYAMSVPHIVSNTLVIYNCCILNRPRSTDTDKIGFASIVTPIDGDFFAYYYANDDDVTYFIHHGDQVTFSRPPEDPGTLRNIINKTYTKNRNQYTSLTYQKEKYYIFREELISVPHFHEGSTVSNTEAFIGIFIPRQLLNQEYAQFQTITLITLGISLLLLLLISFRFAVQMTSPIHKLQQQVHLFDKYREPMSPIKNTHDEISALHASFSRMSAHVLIKGAEIEAEKNKLHIQNQTMKTDLEIARRIQTSLLPGKSPSDNIDYYYKPMLQVGGDFFDFIELESGKQGIFISDVSGHGVSAALVTSMLKSFMLQNKKTAEIPSIFIFELNRFLWDQTGGNFITAIYGVYDPEDQSFTYANAGHSHPLIIRDESVISPLSNNRKPPLGIMSNQELAALSKDFIDQTLQLEENDLLVMFTDGILESVNHEQAHLFPRKKLEEFGDIQFTESLLKQASVRPLSELIQNIVNDLVVFRGNDSFDDDVLLIVISISKQAGPKKK